MDHEKSTLLEITKLRTDFESNNVKNSKIDLSSQLASVLSGFYCGKLSRAKGGSSVR